jgi:N-acylneuraminate cytidylyltransferase
VIDRPACLGDFEPTLLLQHVLESIHDEVENVIVLQPINQLLRPPNLLKDCLEKFQNEKVDSLFTVTQNHQKFEKLNQIFIPFNYEIGQRSQDLKPLYFENGLLYITKSCTDFENRIISEKLFHTL